MISFGSKILQQVDWDTLKSLVASKNMLLQYDQEIQLYTLFALDSEALAYSCTVYRIDPVGVLGYNSGQNAAWLADFEANYKSKANQAIRREEADKILMAGVNFRKTDIADTTYLMLIDLDNYGGYGQYKHVMDTCLNLAGVHGTFRKSNITDDWGCYIGCVLAIDGSQATIGWLRFGTAGLRDTANTQNVETNFTFPLVMCLDVVNGDYVRILTNFKETTGAVNTGTTLEDASGNMRTPAVGDLLMKVQKFSGTGTVTIHYFAWYCTE